MIDLERAMNFFEEYVNRYDQTDGKVNLKKEHTYGVVEFSEYIAKKLGLDEENIRLAKLIGLLHDIGRFEQAIKFNDFTDGATMDHAKYGVKILFEENLIRKFIADSTYDNIIYKAILNHNTFKTEEGLTEQELLHANIIKDSDKLDNFRVKEVEKFEVLFGVSEDEVKKEKISDSIYEDFLNHKLINSSDRKTNLDRWVSYIAFIFDFNFNIGLEYIKDHNYVNILIDRINYLDYDAKRKMENIKVCANKYLEEKCK
jgi:putative nucleotidyltransferase with HDIG domain